MVQFANDWPTGQYFLTPASSEDVNIGATGATGDYLEGFTVIPATATPGAVSIADGANDIYVIPAGTTIGSYYIPVRAYSKSGAWNVTTGTSVSVVAVGKFT
jgi:hypothetical protein